MRSGIEACDLCGRAQGIGLCLLERDARLAPGVRKIEAVVQVLTPTGGIEIDPDVLSLPSCVVVPKIGKAESGGHYAGHSELAIVERDRLAHDVGIAAEPHPESGRDDRAALVGEPLPEPRRTQVSRQRGRDGGA